MDNVIIDRYDIEKNILLIREVDVLELAASRHYLQNVYFALTGEDLSLEAMDEYIGYISTTLQHDKAVKHIKDISRSLQYIEGLDSIQRFLYLLVHIDSDASDVALYRKLTDYDFSRILLLSWLMHLAEGQTTDISDLPILNNCTDFDRWFSKIFSQPYLSALDMNYMMSLLLGGFGIVTPTTAAIRFIASTKNRLSYALIGALSAAGPRHLGACQYVTERLDAVYDVLMKGTIDDARDMYCKARPWPGFGHPVMSRDIRVDAFFERYGYKFERYKRLADAITEQSGLNPNVDYLIGMVFSSWGLKSQLAVLAFFVSRAPILLAHYRLRYEGHSFGMPSKELREKFKDLPKHWL